MKNSQEGMLNLYDYPIDFWKQVLGTEMHYHSGHFLNPVETLETGVSRAVGDLVDIIPVSSIIQARILDLGCGWGGPAFQLARKWNCEVLGIALNKTQVDWINNQAAQLKLPVRAIQADIENLGVNELGKFELVLMYESLSHMRNRHQVFEKLNRVAKTLLLAEYCRHQTVPKREFPPNIFEIPFLDSKAEIVAMLEETGWNIMSLVDRTELVLPTFHHWQDNLEQTKANYPELATQLMYGHSLVQESISAGRIKSIQLVAETT